MMRLSWWGPALLCMMVKCASGKKNCTQLPRDVEATRFEQFRAHEGLSRMIRNATREITRNYKVNGSMEIIYDYVGEDIRDKVGWHILRGTIKEPAGRCFEIPYEIIDVNECTVPLRHAMRHKCHKTTLCQNTNGSYECACPTGSYGAALDEFPACALKTDTSECCKSSECKENFQCTKDSCLGRCVDNAQCIQNQTTKIHECKCPKGFFGTGYHCKGGTAPPKAEVDEQGSLLGSLHPSDYCGCQIPEVNKCVGVQCKRNEMCSQGKCVCKKGYLRIGEECIDKTAINAKLRGENPVYIELGDYYEDAGMDLEDHNKEADKQRQVTVNIPEALLEDQVQETGEFFVIYTIQTNWTDTESIKLKRKVIVKDIDFRTLSSNPHDPRYEKFRPRCVENATVENLPGGRYRCICPEGTEGDGAQKIPKGVIEPKFYQGGTGCTDNTPPQLTLFGPHHVILEVCKCEGLGGIGAGPCARDYKTEIKELLKKDANPKAFCPGVNQCAQALDRIGTEVFDYTDDIKAELDESHGDQRGKEFKIVYKVEDKAKNKAIPKDRIISIKEVSLFELKQLIQQKEQELEKEKLNRPASKPCPVCKEPTVVEKPCPKEVVKVTRAPPTETECENLLVSRNYTVFRDREQGSCLTTTPETTTSRQLASGRSEHTATTITPPVPTKGNGGSLEGAWFFFVLAFFVCVLFVVWRIGLYEKLKGKEMEAVARTGYAPRTPEPGAPLTPIPVRNGATLRPNPYRTM